MIRKKAAVSAALSALALASSAATASGATVVPIHRITWTEQTVFALAPDRSYIAEWNGPGAGWTEIGGSAAKVYAGSAGVFKLDWYGNIWEYNGTPGSWTEIGGPGWEFVEGNGHLYGITPDESSVVEWDGTPNSWTVIGGPASEIAVGGQGVVAMTPNRDQVDLYDGTPGQWTKIGDAAGAISVDSSGIYELDSTWQNVEQWTGGTSWEQIYSSGGLGVELGADGPAGFFIVNGSGEQLEYGGTPGSWTQFGFAAGSGPFVGAVSRTNVYGVTVGTAGVTSVDVYSASSASWTVIGGPAYGGLAAGD
jgi:hypothetical protein